MASSGEERPQEDRPISRALLQGLYDPGSPLSLLRGTPHIMQIIWDFIVAYWKTVIVLPGHEVRITNYVAESEEEDESAGSYCNQTTCKIPFFLSPLMHPFQSCSPISNLVSFPPSTGININMMPFIVSSSFKACRLPKYVRPYWDMILACIGPELSKASEPWWPKASNPSDLGKIYFLTIQESWVEAGESQRRPGIHVDSAGEVFVKGSKRENPDPTSILGEEGNGDADTYRYHPWGGGCAHQIVNAEGNKFTTDGFVLRGGIYLASSVPTSCRAWNCQVASEAVGTLGDVRHLREGMPQGCLLEPGRLYWLTDRTPHESLPLQEGAQRQFFRLVTSQVSLWYTDHSTTNPLGVRPDPRVTKVVRGDKFGVEGVEVVKEGQLKRWKNRIRKGLR